MGVKGIDGGQKEQKAVRSDFLKRSNFLNANDEYSMDYAIAA